MNPVERMLHAQLELAAVEPPLHYRWRGALVPEALAASTGQTLSEYFDSHPRAYVEELAAFHQLNADAPEHKRAFVFVVAYNELSNLPRIVEGYARQEGIDARELQVSFLLNYKLRNDARKNAVDERILQQSISTLAELKAKYPFIHIVAKRFSAETGGLARARKYAMDYALYSCSRSRIDPASAVLISNEGDTLSTPVNYVRAYLDAFAGGRERFVQGNILYPEEVQRAPLLALYAHARERVHLGQGLHDRRYPYYEGIMPTGRNYAVHPKVACLAGGIDPTPRASAEDDLVFGSDIYNLIGNEAKSFAEDIPVITHPRREIVIVNDLLHGRSQDAKKVYEDFHEITDIYDFDWTHYLRLIDTIGEVPDSTLNRCTVVNQFYQWVFRTVLKNYFATDLGFLEIFEQSRVHQIGYWDRENRLWELYVKRFDAISAFEQRRLLRRVVDESLGWFNELLALPQGFNEATVALNTGLVR